MNEDPSYNINIIWGKPIFINNAFANLKWINYILIFVQTIVWIKK
jgi:hypothetical protein